MNNIDNFGYILIYNLNYFQTHSLNDEPDIVLCGHKCDLQEKRLINQNRAREFAKNYQLAYLETSAKTGQNIDRAIEILLDKIMYRYVLINSLLTYI